MHDLGFGETKPWHAAKFVNTETGDVLDVTFVRHWSWTNNNEFAYFSVSTDEFASASDAINAVNTMFNNAGSDPLRIEVRPPSL